MLCTDYIENQISKLIAQEGVQSVRYGLTKWSDAHLIEITPAGIFDSQTFSKIEFSIIDEFESLFPNEEIIFISNNDIISITDLIYSITPESISQSLRSEMDMNRSQQKFNGFLEQSFYIESSDYLFAA